ncbi:MAG: hypothetical protein M3P33_04170 [bacterium]|nr:hypothetical protein [bacterium]
MSYIEGSSSVKEPWSQNLDRSLYLPNSVLCELRLLRRLDQLNQLIKIGSKDTVLEIEIYVIKTLLELDAIDFDDVKDEYTELDTEKINLLPAAFDKVRGYLFNYRNRKYKDLPYVSPFEVIMEYFTIINRWWHEDMNGEYSVQNPRSLVSSPKRRI